MSGFTKLVPEIIQSSIWNEPSDVRVVWITLLAVKDCDGYVRGDSKTVARLANVPHEVADTALRQFQEPDPSSHTPDNDGRRIAPAPGGWIVLNHDLYKERDHKADHAAYVRKWRNRNDVIKCDSHVNHLSVSVSASESASPEGDTGEGQRNSGATSATVAVTPHSGRPTADEARAYATEIGFTGWESWYDHFESNGWKVSGKAPMKDWKAAMRNGKRMAGDLGTATRKSTFREGPRELQARIDAAMGEREKLPPASARTPEQADRARELTARIQGWKREIAGG